jgi:hypothetical protein
MRHYWTNLLMNIYGKKQIVYWVQTFSIQSLFVSIQFEIIRIVHDRPHITVIKFLPLSYIFAGQPKRLITTQELHSGRLVFKHFQCFVNNIE